MKLQRGLQQGSDEISDALNKERKENKWKYKRKIREKKERERRKEGKISLSAPWKMKLDVAVVKIGKQVKKLFWYFKTEHRGG